MSEPSRAPAPTAIGRYRIVRTLGEGPMGGVHLAVRDRQYWTLRLLDEAKVRRLPAASRLHGEPLDPHLIRYCEIGLDPEVGSYLASDPITGDSLPDKMTPRAAANLMLPVLEALALLHGAGGIHGTIKPSNVIIRRATGQAILVDAGLAYAGGPSQRQVLFASAYPYLAPEVIEAYEGGNRDRIALALSRAADTYAAALLLASLLAGANPFAGHARLAELTQAKRQVQLELYGISSQAFGLLRQAIRAATTPDPLQRSRGVNDLVVGLRTFLNG